VTTSSNKYRELKDCLLTSSAFVDFTQDDIDALTHAMSIDEHPDGYGFINEGDRGESLYMLVQGKVQVTRQSYNKKGTEFIEYFKKGALFGLISLIDNGKRSANCQAYGRVTVASLPQSAFVLLCNSNSNLSQRFQFLIARQLARDTRVYNKALREIISNGNANKFYGILRKASYEYRGPERRLDDRRISNDRRAVRETA
jgi:CRP-like cAMP-binding protein